VIATIALLLALVAACGDDSSSGTGGGGSTDARPSATATATSSPAAGEPEAAPHYSYAQVVEALGVTRGRDENGVMHSDLHTGCFATKIFVTPEDNMAAYIQIGDPVATNPSGEIGVAVGTYAGVSESKCLRIFKQRLAKLSPHGN
jgi:hypothetical protein